jgi:hypothetical protein
MNITLICPNDQNNLEDHGSHLVCKHCTQRYEIVDGIVCILEKNDEFYEGAYGNQTQFLPRGEKLWQVWPLWLINSGYVWVVRKSVPQGVVMIGRGWALCSIQATGVLSIDARCEY